MLNLAATQHRFHVATLVAGLVYLGVLMLLAYGVGREQTGLLLMGWALIFGLYLLLYWGSRELPLRPLLVLAVIARLLLLPSMPALSDDFYRFLWDGHLLVAGLHPFSHPPEWYLQARATGVAHLSSELYEQLNSKTYFTIYPPLAQAVFAFAAWLGGGQMGLGVIGLRLPLLLAEAGSIYLLLNLLKRYGLPRRRVLLYALNPLVLLELLGNLHLEALAIFFLLLLLWHLIKISPPESKIMMSANPAKTSNNRNFKGTITLPLAAPDRLEAPPANWKSMCWLAVAFAGAVASKLWPLLLGPFLLYFLGKRWGIRWLLLSAGLLLALFIPLFGKPLFTGMLQSLSLYYQRFEFNASLYYMLREVGWWIMGRNPIVQLGPLLAVMAGGLIVYYSKRAVHKAWSIPETFLLLYGLFLLFATTVHPWYVLPMLALMPLTPYRFPLVWSGLVFLTYAGYSSTSYREPVWLVALEYIAVFSFLFWELKLLNAPENKAATLLNKDIKRETTAAPK